MRRPCLGGRISLTRSDSFGKLRRIDGRHTMIRPLVLLFALLSVLSAEPLRLVAPENGATVPLLSSEQKAYLDLPREERVRRFADPVERKTLRSYGWHPQKVVLSWAGYPDNGARPLYTVEVRHVPDGRPVFRADTVHHRVSIENLRLSTQLALAAILEMDAE